MHFRKVEDRYHVSRITGLHFNFLGLEFSPDAAGRPELVDLREVERRGHLDTEGLLANAALGLEEAARRTGRAWRPRKVFYFSDDTPPLTIYRDLALELALRVAEGRPFEE